MPPKVNHITITPEEQARIDAELIVHTKWGYHSGEAIDYDNVVEMLVEAILYHKTK